jgi:hypothetical protein
LRQTGRSPLLLVLMLSALPTLGAAVEPGGEVPRGYVRLERSGWAWAIPRGSGPPPEALSSRISERLVSIRRRLGRSGTISPVVVRAAHRTEFRRVTRELGGRDPELFVDALAFPTRGIVVYDAERLRSNSIRRAEVLAHEIAHVVLGEAGAGVPRWYHEGAAQWLAGESLAPEMPRLLRRLAAQEALYTFAELPPFPPESQRGTSIYYAQAHLFILHWNDRFGSALHRKLLDRLARGESLEAAFVAQTGLPLVEVERQWHARLAAGHSWIGGLVLGGSLYQVLALVAVVAFFRERRRRLRALSRMSRQEAGVPVDPRSYGAEPSDPEAPGVDDGGAPKEER